MNELTKSEIAALRSLLSNSIDFNKRRITNAGRSVNLDDYVVKRELREVTSGIGVDDFSINGDFSFKSGTSYYATFQHNNGSARVLFFPDAAGNIPILPNSATTETGSGAIVRTTSPTLVTPTVASLTNMQHNHQNAGGGGSLDAAAIGSGNLIDAVLPTNVLSQWTNWAPTFSSDVGNDAATFTATPTITVCRYKQIGKMCHVAVSFQATLNAVTPIVINATLPVTTGNAFQMTPAVIKNGANYETGQVLTLTAPSSHLEFTRANFATWGSGNAIDCRVCFTFEVA